MHIENVELSVSIEILRRPKYALRKKHVIANEIANNDGNGKGILFVPFMLKITYGVISLIA